MGANTYRISTSASVVRGGGSGAENIALTDANEFCQQKGLVMVVANTGHDYRSADVIFRCLSPNDPAARQAPTFERSPDIIIQSR